MSDLKFDNSIDEFGRPPQMKNGFDPSGKLVEWGFVESHREAQYVLIAVGVLALIVAFFIMSRGGTPPPPLLP